MNLGMLTVVVAVIALVIIAVMIAAAATVISALKSLREETAQSRRDAQSESQQLREFMGAKLQTTLDSRLGESFKVVSSQLEQVHKGLGEMQTLASGVGDLKKVLSNIKVRGVWGETQLENLLSEILTPDQFQKNVSTKRGSRDSVEFAVRLPGPDGAGGSPVWLPIDAKFPMEDYQRLEDALEQANPALADAARKQLENRIKNEAKDIRDKYLDPPNTTEFGILFLPVESLYAEILRAPGLWETIQREYRVTLAGPSTLAAILNGLQSGFRTLAIQKKGGEVWSLLGSVKTEFARFGEILDRLQKKIQETGNILEDAARRSRAIEKKLKEVEEYNHVDAG